MFPVKIEVIHEKRRDRFRVAIIPDGFDVFVSGVFFRRADSFGTEGRFILGVTGLVGENRVSYA
jgi:hypothetical protein